MPFFSDLSFESVCDFLTLPSQSTAQTSCIFQIEYNRVVSYTINMHLITEEVSTDLGHFYNGKNVYGIFHTGIYHRDLFFFYCGLFKKPFDATKYRLNMGIDISLGLNYFSEVNE